MLILKLSLNFKLYLVLSMACLITLPLTMQAQTAGEKRIEEKIKDLDRKVSNIDLYSPLLKKINSKVDVINDKVKNIEWALERKLNEIAQTVAELKKAIIPPPPPLPVSKSAAKEKENRELEIYCSTAPANDEVAQMLCDAGVI